MVHSPSRTTTNRAMRAAFIFVSLVVLASVCVSATASHHAHSHTSVNQAKFAEFMKTYGKVYASTEEHQKRFQNFVESLARAEAQNVKHRTNVFGVTQFSDLTKQEFRDQMLTYRPDPNFPKKFTAGDISLTQTDDSIDVADLPTTFDWRQAGVVTNVNDQGQCGACWAFSATETIESAYVLANPWMQSEVANGWGLAVQEVLDCANFGLFGGCNGGWADLAYETVKKRGIMNATDDPYQGEATVCLPLDKPVTYVSNYTFATPPCLLNCNDQDMQMLQKTVATVAPVSVCLDADSWDSYTGGILPASSCSSAFTSMDHCVQLVGYSINQTDPTQNYWLVRNSWGESWGNAGYIYLEMNYSVNTCGLGNQATNVIVSPTPGLDEELMRFE